MSPELVECHRSELPRTVNSEISQSSWLNYGLATAIYLLAMVLTRPVFLSDTMYYLWTANPSTTNFLDFGHLFWRPLIWVLLHQLNETTPAERFLHAFHILDFSSMVAGLIALWVMIATLRLFTRSHVVTSACATLLSFSQVMLTYSKGGCAYIFGFLALSAGFYILMSTTKKERPSFCDALLSGVFLGLAICLWFPYVLAVPGVLLAPALYSEPGQKQSRLVLVTGLACVVLVSMSYGFVAIHLHIHDVRNFATWASTASHGITISGAKRMIFGFARSFISLGENGSRAVLFKRFVLHDPYNPVHLWQIAGLTLWKIFFFYVFLATALVALARSPGGYKALLILLATALPVLGFACLWQGSDLERYFPLLPVLMLALGLALSNVKFDSITGFVACAFVAAVVFTNVFSLSARAREYELRQQMITLRSLNELLPSGSLVLLPPMDPLQRVYWDFPELLPFEEHGLKLQRILDLNTADTPTWRQRAGSQVTQHWNRQIPVVIESSLLEKQPPAKSYWVEGDDPRVHWRDINNFVSTLEIGNRVGNTDYFFIRVPMQNLAVVETRN